MKFRSLLAAAVVLLVLGGVLYWSEHRKPSENASSTSSETPTIVKVDANAVTGFTLQRKHEQPITVVKSSGHWQITAPTPAAADADAITGMLSNLSSLTAQRVVEDKAGNLAQFGLSDPSVELDVTTKGNKTTRLLLGDNTPTGDAVYAAVAGDPRVFTAASFVKTSLNKSEDDLRDKRLLPINADSVSRIELIRKGQDIDVGRVQNGWQIEKPKPYRTDTYQVGDLLQQVVGAKWQPSEGGADPAKAFAQATPFATVKLTGGSGTDTLELRKDKDDYYAKSSMVQGVYKADAALGTALNRGLDEFRNKQLFDFGYSDPDKIEYHAGATNLVLTHAGHDWTADGKKMDADSAEGLVTALRDLAASKFVDSGFTTPEIEVTVTSNGGKKVEKAGIAKSGDGGIAKREDGPSQYYLDATAMSNLTSAAAGVKPAAPPAKK